MSEVQRHRIVRHQRCPNCEQWVTMVPYDIGSGPEMSCPQCEWCWGADGQPLSADDPFTSFPVPTGCKVASEVMGADIFLRCECGWTGTCAPDEQQREIGLHYISMTQ